MKLSLQFGSVEVRGRAVTAQTVRRIMMVLGAVLLCAGLASGSVPKLLIVGPVQFEAALAPLVAQKNQTGMPCRFLSMEAVRASETPKGGNDAEKLKTAIARFCLDGGRYVMLVGDMSLVPCCRRSVENLPGNPDALIWHYGYVTSELFYENLFRTHTVGKDGAVRRANNDVTYWDLNGNKLYNEQHWKGDPVSFNPDQVDGYPDIAVGRVPAHDVDDVTRFAQKIIRYETGAHSGQDHATFFFGQSYEDSYGMTNDIVEHSGIKSAMPPDTVSLLGLAERGDADQSGAPKEHAVADEAAFDLATTNSLFLGYLGHGGPTLWAATVAERKAVGRDIPINQDMIPAALHNPESLPIVLSVGCETGRHTPCVPHDEYVDVDGITHWYWWGNAGKTGDHRIKDVDTGKTYDEAVTVPEPSVYDMPKYQPRTFAYYWLCKSMDAGGIAFMGEEVVCQNDLGRDFMTDLLANYRPGAYDAAKKWRPSGKRFVLGDLWLEGQRKYWRDYHDYEGDNSVFRNARIYLGIMNFYGDPSLRLPVLKG